MTFFTLKSTVRCPTDMLRSAYNRSWFKYNYNFQQNNDYILVCSGKQIGTLSMEWLEEPFEWQGGGCDCQGTFFTIYKEMEDLDSFLLREDIELELKEKIFRDCGKHLKHDYRKETTEIITLQQYLDRIQP